MAHEEDLKQAIELIRGGNKQAGGKILHDILKKEPRNEQAWLWMAACSQKPDDKKYCFERVLILNPENETARKALEKINATPTLEELGVLESEQPAPAVDIVPGPILPPVPAADKKCPYCAMTISVDAILCPYCHKDVRKSMVVGEQLTKAGCALMQLPFVIGGLVLSLAALWCLISSMFSK